MPYFYFVIFLSNFGSSFNCTEYKIILLQQAFGNCDFLMGKQMGYVITAQYYLFSHVAFCYSYQFILGAFLNKKLL